LFNRGEPKASPDRQYQCKRPVALPDANIAPMTGFLSPSISQAMRLQTVFAADGHAENTVRLPDAPARLSVRKRLPLEQLSGQM
jgi:hypothetical protein